MSQAGSAQVKLDCPDCGQPCTVPFYRGSLVARIHDGPDGRGPGHRSCRFMVSVDPTGDDHRFRVLDRTEKFEEVYNEMWHDHHVRLSTSILAECIVAKRDEVAA